MKLEDSSPEPVGRRETGPGDARSHGLSQVAPRPGKPAALEIIVPYDDPCDDVTRLAARYPEVRFVHADGLDFDAARASGSHEPFDVLRTVGLKAARGRLRCTDRRPRDARSAVVPHPGPITRRASRAGPLGAPGVRVEPCAESGHLYCDFGRYQNPIPEGPARFVSDSNVVYRRTALEEIRASGTVASASSRSIRRWSRRGRPIWLTPRVTAWQKSGSRDDAGRGDQGTYIWGRAFAGIRFDRRSVGRG